MRAFNLTRDRVLGESVREAGSFPSRVKGLLGRDGLGPGEGLWIRPCVAIHSLGMRFSFDALFLDAGMRVIGAYRRFPRNRLSKIFPAACGVLELPAGTIGDTGTEVGDRIRLGEG